MVLAMICSEMLAADYVFMSGDNYVIINNSGAFTTTTTFNPSTCLWSGTSGGAFTNNGKTLKYSQTSQSYIVYTTYGAPTFNTTGTDVPVNISEDGTLSMTARTNSIGGTQNYYIQFNGSALVSSTTSNANNVKAYQVTTTPAITPTFSISYPSADGSAYVGSVGGTMTISTSVSGNYRPAYYSFNNGIYLEDGTKVDSAPNQASNYNYTYELVGECTNYATISGSTVTYTQDAGHDVVAQVKVSAKPEGYNVVVGEGTCSFVLRSATVSAPVITPGPGQNQYTITGPANSSIKYTTNGTDLDATASNGTEYTGPITITIPNTVIKAKAVRDGKVSTQTEYTIESIVLAAPVITISDAGSVTIANPNGSAGTIYYTKNGTDPTTNSSSYSGAFTVNNMETVKAIVAGGTGYITSQVASKQYKVESGVSSDGVVTLNDYEDHTWTYYAGVDASVDGGNYNTNYAGKIYSPNPRNVKITYKANGGAVSIVEGETEFVYYKTIEKVGGTYKYQVISNPFSKRPVVNSKVQGFAGWKITGGADYIKNKAANATLALDEEIELENLPYPSINCTSAEIELTATWTDATVVRNTTSGLSNSGTYETNIIVLTNKSNALTPNYPCTIMMVEPDGSADYRTYTLTGSVTPPSGGIAKIEYATWNPNGAIAMAGRNLWIGRGVTCSGTTRSITLAANNGTINQVAKIESGSFTSLTHYSNTPSGITKQILVLGNDYDRANSVNNKLTFSGAFIVSNCNVGNNYQEACRVYSKSGSFMTGINISTAAKDYSYYMSRYTTSGPKRSRYIEIEGGEWYASINGGQDNNGTTVDTEHDLFVFRMRGGKVRGCVYGAAEQTNSSGNRVMVFTGGQVGGWICGASNGTSTSGGILYGKTFVYFGGNAECNTKYQERTPAAIRNSLGGYVYGCGCGSSATSHVGEVNQGTNVVMADNAKVQYGVYGGGAYGYSSGTANVYVTGGHVESSYDASYNVYCGVYGGARQNDAGPTNVYMTGGLIEGNIHNSTQGGGLFGGCNAQGDLTGSVNMVITGGQVGTTSQTANIHGGGYGSSTSVSGNVDIKLGTTGAPLGADGVVVYGDVYGGSAEGKVNSSTSNHTNVTLNAGTVNGNIFGGGLGVKGGAAADVNGNVAVTVNGGSLNIGGVFGCNNQNGTPKGTVTVTVNHTNPSEYDASGKVSKYAINAVYGGGNQIAYSGMPVVHIVNCDCSIKEVYGGGNAADVGKDASAATSPHTDATDVTIDGGEIDYAFGGGNGSGTGNPGANVKGNANLKIGGGTINNIFGGSNTLGDVYGNANVTLEDINPDCPITVEEVYGGANRAPMAGKPVLTINCIKNKLSNVYGGSKAVDVNSDIVLNINSGQYGKVFGGNNESGAVKGSITVNIDETGCHPIIIDELYAGGNMAAYTTPAGKSEPTVNVISCTHIGQVFGGGYGKSAVITGNPIVNINQIPGEYDPEDKDASDGYSNNTNGKLGTIGTVFGGGNAANVVGNTHVNIGTLENNAHLTTPTNTTKVGANITGNVYGGGNAADVTGRTNVTVGRQKN